MLLTVRTAATYDLAVQQFVILMIEPLPHSRSHQVRQERLVTTPTLSCVLRHDLYGNPQRHLIAAQGPFQFEFRATIETLSNTAVPPEAVEHTLQGLPTEAMVYTLPSRFCQSDLLGPMAQREFGQLPPGGGRVQAIADWVRGHVEYRPGTTQATTSAFDTANDRVGVCRDFAHLVIAFCRGLGIPARYVSAYALGLEPPDFHAYAQVYLGGLWYNVDATFDGVRPALVPIAIGRDAADVSMTTLNGPNALRQQAVEVSKVSGSAP
jgi:transglutaminase-like putative cysteine protease